MKAILDQKKSIQAKYTRLVEHPILVNRSVSTLSDNSHQRKHSVKESERALSRQRQFSHESKSHKLSKSQSNLSLSNGVTKLVEVEPTAS